MKKEKKKEKGETVTVVEGASNAVPSSPDVIRFDPASHCFAHESFDDMQDAFSTAVDIEEPPFA